MKLNQNLVLNTQLKDQLKEFDSITREGLTRILGTPLSDRTWQQAKLPVSMGGMGLRAAEDHAPAAHAASVLASQPLSASLLRRRPEEPSPPLPQLLLDGLTFALGEETSEESLEGVSQKMLGLRIDQHLQRQLQEEIGQEEERERARLLSLTLPHAGDWLNTPPLTALGLHLRPAEFVLASKYRLGLDVYSKTAPCPACLRLSDTKGDHAMSCGTGGERIARHNHLRDALFEMAVSAVMAPTKEGRFLLPGDDRRPADVFISYWTSLWSIPSRRQP